MKITKLLTLSQLSSNKKIIQISNQSKTSLHNMKLFILVLAKFLKTTLRKTP